MKPCNPFRVMKLGNTDSTLLGGPHSTVPFQMGEDSKRENVSEASDIYTRDRALYSNTQNESDSIQISIDNALQNEVALPILEDNASPVPPLPEELISLLSSDAIVYIKDEKLDKEAAIVLLPILEHISRLLFLSVLGILGVLTRYILQKLFGPNGAGVMSDHYPLYLDLPSNMVGSFLMGWLGVVFKGDIVSVSDHLALGLTTGYLGSLTTFSGWNQKMLDLTNDGHWGFALVGFLLDFFLVAYSIKFGIGTATCFKSFLKSLNKNGRETINNWRVDNYRRRLTVMVALVLMLAILLSLSGIMLKKEFNNSTGSNEAQLWLACLVAAPGVWIRWLLARLNGRGLGKAWYLKWVPVGTLVANVSAAWIMAGLATLKKAVQTKTCIIVSTGIQFGFLGSLSTVSTFIAEYNAMEESDKNWRAYAYALTTIIPSFGLGVLIYFVPVWTKAI